jgi:hypothetical protein
MTTLDDTIREAKAETVKAVLIIPKEKTTKATQKKTAVKKTAVKKTKATQKKTAVTTVQHYYATSMVPAAQRATLKNGTVLSCAHEGEAVLLKVLVDKGTKSRSYRMRSKTYATPSAAGRELKGWDTCNGWRLFRLAAS